MVADSVIDHVVDICSSFSLNIVPPASVLVLPAPPDLHMGLQLRLPLVNCGLKGVALTWGDEEVL